MTELSHEDLDGLCVLNIPEGVYSEHDWTIGLQLHGGPRMDTYLTDWYKRFVICRRCHEVIENDGTPEFSIDWARILLKTELE